MRAGASLRQLSRDTKLSLNTIISADQGNPISPSTRHKIALWLSENPPVDSPELSALLLVGA
jgi:hypothetical protein